MTNDPNHRRQAAGTSSAPNDPQARRLFLRGGSLVAGGLGLLTLGLSTPAGAADSSSNSAQDVGIMQGALALEHEGIAAYRLAGGSGLLSPGTLKVALLFKGHHEQHRDSLAALITKAGGKPVDPKSDDAYVKELDLGSLNPKATSSSWRLRSNWAQPTPTPARSRPCKTES